MNESKPALSFKASLAIVFITAAIFYYFEFTGETDSSAVMGGILGTITVVFIKLSEKTMDLLAALIPCAMVVITGCLYLSHEWLWLGLWVLNVPACIRLARYFFEFPEDFVFSLSNIIDDDTCWPKTDEEAEAGFKGILYVASCVSLVLLEYKLITFFF